MSTYLRAPFRLLDIFSTVLIKVLPNIRNHHRLDLLLYSMQDSHVDYQLTIWN